MKLRWLYRILWLVAVLGGLVFIVSFPVESSYASRSKLIQRIKPSAESELFGDAGEKIGTPQELIIDDASVFLVEPTAEGVAQVDENKLQEKAIYPLQLQTVRFVASTVRLGSGIALGIGALGVLLLRKRVVRSTSELLTSK